MKDYFACLKCTRLPSLFLKQYCEMLFCLFCFLFSVFFQWDIFLCANTVYLWNLKFIVNVDNRKVIWNIRVDCSLYVESLVTQGFCKNIINRCCRINFTRVGLLIRETNEFEWCWSTNSAIGLRFPYFQISRSHGTKIADFHPNGAFPDCNSNLNSTMAMKCCTKLEVA